MQSSELVRESVRQHSDTRSAREDQARVHLVQDLNRLMRRLRQYDSEQEWLSATIEAASYFADQVAIFELRGDQAHLRGQAQLDLKEGLSFPLANAAAFSGATQSLDPVIALRTVAEVSESLATSDLTQRVYVLPIYNGKRVSALLFAPARTGEGIDFEGLELVASVAGLALRQSFSVQEKASLVDLTPKPDRSRDHEGAVSLPSLARLSEPHRELHLRAHRFARVAVAQMNLFRPAASRAGREQCNIYLFLQKEIDKARESYRTQFLTIPSMVDYLHLELVRTTADGDERKLGVDYPGQLV
jgi:hypothetical protein